MFRRNFQRFSLFSFDHFHSSPVERFLLLLLLLLSLNNIFSRLSLFFLLLSSRVAFASARSFLFLHLPFVCLCLFLPLTLPLALPLPLPLPFALPIAQPRRFNLFAARRMFLAVSRCAPESPRSFGICTASARLSSRNAYLMWREKKGMAGGGGGGGVGEGQGVF